MKRLISLHIFAVLSGLCNYSLDSSGIKNVKIKVSERIAHVDLCSKRA